MTLSRTELAAVWSPTAAVAASAGHDVKSPMKAIREKCLDCCVGQISGVQRCEALKCSLWPLRAGKHPYTSGSRKNPLHEASFQESDGIEDGGDEQ